MQFLCIGVNKCTDDAIDSITNGLSQLKSKKISYSISKAESEGFASIICSINDDRQPGEKPDQSYNALAVHVSNTLADHIISQYEEKLAARIINSNYCYFNNSEKKDILRLALKIIRNEDKNFFNSLFQIRRRNIIIRKLLDYFENSNDIILDGFVNFRLKDYIKDLEEIVDKAVDEFLMQREYREFIRLLRYFVDIQEPKANLIHVIAGYDGKYMLLDEEQNEITNECIQEFVTEIPQGDINYDDLLVSSLITLAPKNIHIHGMREFKNKELLETIKNVFAEKVSICSGCDICAFRFAKSETKK